ncbi:M90 metallopeptidase family protein [Portibacter marinus]|uniref:zinc-dependent peptidase n=1 Tax=Portibacter marinus TaxID=2898660 RepID=UPI001F35EEE9|nr:zinc-dependent peptidase [Portibacter marinus]
MRGIRFAMLLALPFIIGALYTGVKLIYFEQDEFLYPFLAVIAIGLAIFFAKEEINFWYDQKYPPKLDEPIRIWLRNFFPFYSALETKDRERFETRLALYLNARSFQLMLKERKDIPEDFKAIIAAHAIQMTIGLEDYLIGDYDRIICYNHPFPTPGNQFLHTVETHLEDGIILISLEQLMMGIREPKKNYNLAYHAYAEALLTIYPELQKIEELDISKILPYELDHVLKITGFSKENIGLKTLQLVAFYVNGPDFKKSYPEAYHQYANILKYVH